MLCKNDIYCIEGPETVVQKSCLTVVFPLLSTNGGISKKNKDRSNVHLVVASHGDALRNEGKLRPNQ